MSLIKKRENYGDTYCKQCSDDVLILDLGDNIENMHITRNSG
jgi:hypothetical protein